MKFFIKTKLSENISETPEGFLLCRNVPLTHTGALQYVHPEHPFGADYPEVVIKRDPSELFSRATTASFEGKDITIQHPEDFVSPDNYQELTHGVMFNVRKLPTKVEVEGEQVEVLGADFLIKSKEAIELVKGGMREVSLGYDAVWELISDEEGRHSKIIGNHCALVDEGRAGKHCAITDHKKEKELMGKEALEKFKKLFGKSVDEAMKEKEDEQKAKDEAEAKKAADEEAAKKAKDEEEKKKKEESKDEESSELSKRLDKVEGMLTKLLEKLEGKKSEDEDEEESKDEDEESEEVVEDEEEDESEDEESEGCDEDGSEDDLPSEEEKKKDKAGDTMSRAEILAPGIKKTKDVMSKALAKAYKTKDGKKVIDSLTGGKDPSTLPAVGVQAIFVAAAEMLKTKRVHDMASTRVMTIDSFPGLKGTGAKTADDINKLNADFYNSKK
jgi:hypothetical protein